MLSYLTEGQSMLSFMGLIPDVYSILWEIEAEK